MFLLALLLPVRAVCDWEIYRISVDLLRGFVPKEISILKVCSSRTGLWVIQNG